MFLREVGTNKSLIKKFLEFPVGLYAEDNAWIRPLDNDIESVFNPKKNKHFKNGEAIRWIMENSEGKVVGRVAAFYENKKLKPGEHPVGGMGFFESIEQKEVAFALMDAAKEWLKDKGMKGMDGPINFGERDSFWGLMVQGWGLEPTYKMPYTKHYYINFFEDYGFQDYFQQYVFESTIQELELDSFIHRRAEAIFNNPEYYFQSIEKSNLQKYAEDFRTIFNKAWASFPGVNEMSSEQAQSLVKSMKPILDEQLLWFAYTTEGDPVAFFIVIPDLNQIIKHVNGKLNWLGIIKFLLLKAKGVVNRACGVIFGVVPEHQKKGIEAAIALRFKKEAENNPFYPYRTMEMNWIGDFNPKMLRFVNSLGSNIIKTFITYRIFFDKIIKFERCPKI